jgi:3-methyladenine DNA glycosylase AlkD
MNTANDVIHALKKISNPEIAKHSTRFFKAGPGEYAEGDRFLGIRVPEQRKIARRYKNISLDEAEKLLESDYHEVRLTALFILVNQYKKAGSNRQKKIYRFYIDHLEHVNNWDLVDSSAKYIAGHYLFEKDRDILYKLAESNNLWKRRVALLTTFYFIDQNDFSATLQISEKLLDDKEDLIHKASGWMLREIGIKNKPVLTGFLNKHYKNMPRTMLRYAIEKFPDEERQKYLKGLV